MTNKANLLHALLERMQQQTAEVNKAMDDLQKAMEAVPSAERTGPEWDAFSAEAHPEWRQVTQTVTLQVTPPFEPGFYRFL